jgi:hypothetical protein
LEGFIIEFTTLPGKRAFVNKHQPEFSQHKRGAPPNLEVDLSSSKWNSTTIRMHMTLLLPASISLSVSASLSQELK